MALDISKMLKTRKVWHAVNIKGLVSHMAFNAHHSSSWYLDSGCSMHVKGDTSLFIKMEKFKGGLVTFGDGNKGKIKGEGTVSIPGFPYLNDVLCVEGLKASL